MVIRWMKAFRGRWFSLLQSLEWEFNNQGQEVAGELLPASGESNIVQYCKRCHVGLLASTRSVVRKFSFDCYSEEDFDHPGRLRPTRSSSGSDHGEAFCNGEWVAIVITRKVTKKELRTVRAMSEKYNVPIVTLRSLKKK